MNPMRLVMAYKLARAGQTYYGVIMKFFERIKSRIKFVIALVLVYCLVVLALLLYIAIKLT